MISQWTCKKSTAIPGVLLSQGDQKDPQIRIFSYISLKKHFRGKFFEQKLFLIKFRTKEVISEICVQAKGKPWTNVRVYALLPEESFSLLLRIENLIIEKKSIIYMVRDQRSHARWWDYSASALDATVTVIPSFEKQFPAIIDSNVPTFSSSKAHRTRYARIRYVQKYPRRRVECSRSDDEKCRRRLWSHLPLVGHIFE